MGDPTPSLRPLPSESMLNYDVVMVGSEDETDEEEFVEWGKLTKATVDSCALHKLDASNNDVFRSLPVLAELHLPNAKITSLGNIEMLRILKVLDLSFNSLTVSPLTHLEEGNL